MMTKDRLEENRRPLIVDIKRHSLEDGPGIRSVVFFKGCPLRCLYCQNPETQEPYTEIAFSAKYCIQCGRCREICPEGAISLESDIRIDRAKCTRCGECVSVCPGKGLRTVARFLSVEKLAEVLLRDLPFYRHSGGGVTLSGGECTLYPEYLEQLLKILKPTGVHLSLETSGHFDYDIFQQNILPYLDSVYFSTTIADPEAHRKYTGRTNRRIISNLRRLLQERTGEVHPVIPLVPGITATRENLSAIAGLLCEMRAREVSLLPYNPMGVHMAACLGRARPTLPEAFMSPEEELELCEMFKRILRKEEMALVS